MRRLKALVASLRRIKAARAVYVAGVGSTAYGCSMAWAPAGPIVGGLGLVWAAYDLVDIAPSDDKPKARR